ncbi:MAG: ribonuclease J, partial [Epsilonproteobacteria bacterium]|nr:ribonuclease J [Campylobacterota bacterium]
MSENNETKEHKNPNPHRRNPNPYRQNTEATASEQNSGNKNTMQKKNRFKKPFLKNNRNNNANPAESQQGAENRTNEAKSEGRNDRRKNPVTVSEEMNRSIQANLVAQDLRMNPWKMIDTTNNAKVRFTPLGGLGEIGGNMAVIETEDSAIVFDVGMSFPDETMHGVDILVPDFSYLHTIKDKIKAIIISHAHEDHIGGMPYLFKELKFPIYGTPLALAMIKNKFDEHGLRDDSKYFNFITKRQPYPIGDFVIEWMHMTHSIIDSCSLAIQTPAGTIIHTGDFKIDYTPIDGYGPDL